MLRNGLAIALSVMLTTGCGNSILDFRNAEVSAGKIFQSGENIPFSGNVTNIPLGLMPVKEISESSSMVAASTNDQQYSQFFLVMSISSMMSGSKESPVVCDSQVKEGILNGVAVCKTIKNNIHVFDIPFANGSLEGDLVIYNFSDGKDQVAKFGYKNGLRNGVSKIYNPKNGHLVNEANWVDGKTTGAGKLYYLDSGNLFQEVSKENNLLHGPFKEYSENGKMVKSGVFEQGMLNGTLEEYSPETGKLLKKTIYKNGQPVNDNLVAPVGSNNAEACFEAWLSAFKSENGEDVPVRQDQIGEWEALCSEGKNPSNYQL